MKKALFAIAIAGLAMTSCKKEYTCTCISKEDGVVTGETTWTAKMKKSDADNWCENYSSTSTFFGSTYTEECHLK